VADGKENSQIGEALFTSPKTVKNHVANILDKLEIDRRYCEGPDQRGLLWFWERRPTPAPRLPPRP
jgi:hypothetical protein